LTTLLSVTIIFEPISLESTGCFYSKILDWWNSFAILNEFVKKRT